MIVTGVKNPILDLDAGNNSLQETQSSKMSDDVNQRSQIIWPNFNKIDMYCCMLMVSY